MNTVFGRKMKPETIARRKREFAAQKERNKRDLYRRLTERIESATTEDDREFWTEVRDSAEGYTGGQK